MSKRLRHQEVTKRPRVIVNGGSYKLEWLGHHSGQAVAVGYSTLGEAIDYGRVLAHLYNRDAA
ncbi:hypothetical protein [Paenarthrobacter sp. JL.01a]|uniref:hypothetical protein n=1 Tax=Paenarthrobacter sp. JL.01a TaxID=2979324 RepID=UPI0021C6FE60|nr:hypothetical protein [Paenarthrobacter sp. JL.01a]UXM90906.1 hypothetical protein N5P29_16645 [Paenarthrobacter sp. JL.01a]